MAKEYNLWSKLRSAMRAVWRYSPSHREALKKVIVASFFDCPMCGERHHKAMASVDHNPQLGSFNSWETFGDWTQRLFEGNVRVLCKICHASVTKAQRKKK